MFETFRNLISKSLSRNKRRREGFENAATVENDDNNLTLPYVLAFLIVLLLQLLLGRYLWNNYLVRFITIARPIPGVIDFLAISLLARLMIG